MLGTSEIEIFEDYDIAIQFSKGERWQRSDGRARKLKLLIARCCMQLSMMGLPADATVTTARARGQLDPRVRS